MAEKRGPKFGKRLSKRGSSQVPGDLKTEQVNFLVWTDVVDEVPASETAEKLGVSRQAIESRRAKIKAFVDPDGTLLPKWRGVINRLAVDAINTLHFHLTERKDKDLAIRILENIKALEVVNATQPSAGGPTVQQFFGLGQVSDADRSRLRSSINAAYPPGA